MPAKMPPRYSEIVDACAIITGPANGVVAALRDRMPLVVPSPGYDRWLSHEARTPELLKLVETDAGTLISYPVNPIVNSAQNDDPRCAEPRV
jgi:putative SOS response-associated peptidase YedK